MNLNYFEILTLGATPSDLSESANFVYEKRLPAGDLVDFTFTAWGEDFGYEMWINNEVYIAGDYVRINSVGRDQMLADLEENIHETFMRFAKAKPGSKEFLHLEELCRTPPFAKKF